MKILRNITNISSGASFPLISHLHMDSLHSDTPFLIQTHPPHHFTSPRNHLRWSLWMQQATLSVSLSLYVCVCVCLQRAGREIMTRLPVPPASICLHKLIRPQCSHHLFYWERRSEHSQEIWDFECRSVFVWSWACVIWREGWIECGAVIGVLDVEQKCVSFSSCVGDPTHCMWFVGMWE